MNRPDKKAFRRITILPGKNNLLLGDVRIIKKLRTRRMIESISGINVLIPEIGEVVELK